MPTFHTWIRCEHDVSSSDQHAAAVIGHETTCMCKGIYLFI